MSTRKERSPSVTVCNISAVCREQMRSLVTNSNINIQYITTFFIGCEDI